MSKKKKRNNIQKPNKKSAKKRTLGNLPSQHNFFLNPYEDSRFTRCPQCREKTKIRKRPFVVHVDSAILMTINMSSPYCPDCDLIILHQNDLEHLLVAKFSEYDPSIIGNNYLVVGTLKRTYFHKANKQGGTYGEFFDSLHDFKKVVTFEPQHWVWGLEDTQYKDKQG